MPLDLADALYQHLLDRFPADRDYPRGDLYVEGMPPLVASLLGRTLDRWLEHELDSLESRWFDFDDPAVRAARAELIVALGRTARVPRGAWAETLRYAVGAVVRHLVTPARALTDATFEGQTDALPTATVQARLHTFEAYPYLPEIAEAYLKQKQPQSVDCDTFQGLLLRIDRRVTSEYTVEDWLRLLGPLFKLARRLPDLKGLPAYLLEEFFSAKGEEAVAEALSDLGDRLIDESALHELLARTLGQESRPTTAAPKPERHEAAGAPAAPEQEMSPEAEDSSPVEAQAPEPEEVAPAEQPPPIDQPEQDVSRGAIADRLSESPAVLPAQPEEPQPLWKRFARHPIGPTVETSVPDDQAAAVPRSEEHAAADPGAERPPLWQRFLAGIRGQSGDGPEAVPEGEVPETPMEPPSLVEVEQRVLGRAGRRNRRRYVRDLFAGDEHAYAAVLQEIDQAGTWSQASQIIAGEVFRRFGVDIYSDVAVEFTDTVNARFEQ